ncbi:TniQ family protein [Bradyrhizobium manausense]|uniref:TniQ family protein n=1 Tax=Bradyrhizobium manausense TaxID=989370 RepID=UPI001BABAD27|nr:TniQ family protein [Bradyrhizobium manausense]MBR0689858.1 TniQ family protein [Bradyrhizobium manausense]
MNRATAICFEPLDGESTSSLLLRAASSLSPVPGLVVEGLLGDAEVVASAVHRQDSVDAIVSNLGVERDALQRTMIHRDGENLRVGPFVVRTQDIDQTHRRVCPAALRNDALQGRSPYQRLNWAIRVLRFDADTGGSIIDRCGCGRDLLWRETARIDECPACGCLLWEAAPSDSECQDGEAVHFLSKLFSNREHRREEARSALPSEILEWTEADLLELFETLGLFSHPEVLMRIPRADVELWSRAAGIHATLNGMGAIRNLIECAFEHPPAGADRFWPARRMAFANLAIHRCRSSRARDLLGELLRSFV